MASWRKLSQTLSGKPIKSGYDYRQRNATQRCLRLRPVGCDALLSSSGDCAHSCCNSWRPRRAETPVFTVQQLTHTQNSGRLRERARQCVRSTCSKRSNCDNSLTSAAISTSLLCRLRSPLLPRCWSLFSASISGWYAVRSGRFSMFYSASERRRHGVFTLHSIALVLIDLRGRVGASVDRQHEADRHNRSTHVWAAKVDDKLCCCCCCCLFLPAERNAQTEPQRDNSCRVNWTLTRTVVGMMTAGVTGHNLPTHR